jgi:hypothetical protein
MPLPKKSKNDINVYPLKTGKERVEQILSEVNEHTNFGLETITLENIDTAFLKYFKENVPEIDGKKLNIFFLKNDRWADFKKTWTIRDGDKNILLPYGTIARKETQKGKRNGDIFKVPQLKKFQYLRVPTMDDDKTMVGYDIYKIPQPTPVDMTYTFTLLTKYFVDVNKMDEYILTLFSSLQAFIFYQGYYFTMQLDGSAIDDEQPLDAEKMYKKDYTITLQGFIQNANDIEITKGIKRSIISTELKP